MNFTARTAVRTAAVSMTCLFWATALAQSPEVSPAQILGFDIQGINASMGADQARSALLGAGFTEKGDGANWGKVPVATFTRDDITVSIAHYEGRIQRINDTRIATGELLDYQAELQRIVAHFGAAGDQGCNDQPHGARCGFRGAGGDGARFSASLTPQMIFIQVASQP